MASMKKVSLTGERLQKLPKLSKFTSLVLEHKANPCWLMKRWANLLEKPVGNRPNRDQRPNWQGCCWKYDSYCGIYQGWESEEKTPEWATESNRGHSFKRLVVSGPKDYEEIPGSKPMRHLDSAMNLNKSDNRMLSFGPQLMNRQRQDD